MAPIKVGLVGLSANSGSGWASKAHLPYLLSPRGRERYEIVALLNSSKASAHAAIAHYNLPASTRAYGSADDLAADADIELVVVVTRVDVHHSVVLPSLKAAAAGKKKTDHTFGAFVEWPLADNIEKVRELNDIAAGHSEQIRTAVGVQGRLAPVYGKVREVLKSGRIGRVLSSQVWAAGNTFGRDSVPEGLEYFSDRSVGGNVYHIAFAHLIDALQSVLGELGDDAKPHFQLQRPDVKVVDKTGKVVKTIKSDVPDLFTVVGSLATPAKDVADRFVEHAPGASFLIHYRRGPAFAGDPGLVWHIIGEKGELRLVSPTGPSVHAGSGIEEGEGKVTIDVENYTTNKVESVPWHWADAAVWEDSNADKSWVTDLPLISRAIGLVYDEYAAGEKNSGPGFGHYATFGEATQRHEQLDKWLKAFPKL